MKEARHRTSGDRGRPGGHVVHGTWLSRFVIGLILLLMQVVGGSQLGAANIDYIYDELGRLRAVVDPASETAVYSYDAVGNLLKITRQNSSLVSIIELIPDSGPVGTPVTIYGTGFSSTASQNTVKFKNTTAIVVSATSTQIVTSVPTGATTGAVTVTTPTETATSSTNFTVAAPAGAPTISSFSPTIAGYGTAVTINGTNFSTTVANNKVKTNVANAGVTSATAIKLVTAVSSQATSGHIKVTTPAGTVTSAGDLFVAPYPNLASAVGFTGRMAFGETQSVTIATANKFGIMVFDGTAGQSVSLNLGNGTITAYLVNVNSPLGPQLLGASGGTSASFIEPFPLPITGTYSIIIAPQSTYVGTVPLTLNTITDVSGTIVPGGPPVTVTTTVSGQNASLTFTGVANQRVSLAVSGNTIPGMTYLYLKKPDGTTLASTNIYSTATGFFFDDQTLPTAGTYSIYVDPEGTSVGNMTLTLYDAPDVTGPIVPGGVAVTVTTTVPGQNVNLTFTGAANQRVSLAMSGSTAGSVRLYLKKPDGTTLASVFVGAFAFIDVQTLPTAGTYSVFWDPQGTAVGSATLQLYDVPPDVTGPIMPSGSPVTVTTTPPGQNASLTFTGAADQRVSFAMSGSTFGFNVNVYLKKPDGTQLAYAAFGGATGFMDTQTLPVSGTYTLFIDPTGTNTGTAQFTLYDVVDITGALTVGGAAVPVTIDIPGQNGRLTFSGTAGQPVTVSITGNTISYVVGTLLKPDGTTLTSLTLFSASGNFPSQTLPTTGTYTVVIDPQADRVGSLNVAATSP